MTTELNYLILDAPSTEELQDQVNSMIAEGFVPVGGIAVEPDYVGPNDDLVHVYFQAVVFSGRLRELK